MQPNLETIFEAATSPKYKLARQLNSATLWAKKRGSSFIRGDGDTYVNPTKTNFKNVDFKCKKKNERGERHNFKIVNWNVGGLRALIRKGGIEYIQRENADVVCLQVF